MYLVHVNLLVISTGKYKQFVKPLLDSIEEYFFCNDDVKVFLFTDDLNVDSRAIIIEQEHMPWPLPTLKRFDIFSKNKLFYNDKNSFTFYLDCDSLFVNPVSQSILPENDEIVVVQHPGFWEKPGTGTWETRKESMAFVPFKKRINYFAGGFYGARTSEFIKLVEECNILTNKDLTRDIIPVHNDESILQAYVVNKPKKILTPAYVYPEGGQQVHKWFTWLGESKILALNKCHEELRN